MLAKPGPAEAPPTPTEVTPEDLTALAQLLARGVLALEAIARELKLTREADAEDDFLDAGGDMTDEDDD